MTSSQCNDYFSVTFGNGPLGFSVIQTRQSDFKLGKTVVESLQQTGNVLGQAERAGVQPGDVIVSINHTYMAFTPHAEVVSMIKSAGKPIILQFARPNRDHYNSIASETNFPIICGQLQKQAGFFNKWKPRMFTLTKDSLYYAADGTVKKRFALLELSNVSVCSSSDRPYSFQFNAGGGPVLVATETAEERILWMHAIECAINRAFDKPVGPPVVQHSQPITSPVAQQTVVMQKPNIQAATTPTGYNQQTPSLYPNVPPPMVVRKPTVEKDSDPYWMLRYTRVKIVKDGVNGAQMPDINIPENLTRVITLDYDYSTERKVLESRG